MARLTLLRRHSSIVPGSGARGVSRRRTSYSLSWTRGVMTLPLIPRPFQTHLPRLFGPLRYRRATHLGRGSWISNSTAPLTAITLRPTRSPCGACTDWAQEAFEPHQWLPLPFRLAYVRL